jgi:hypothetical protein
MTATQRETIYRRYNFLRIWQKRYAHMLARQRGVASHQSNGARGKPICTPEEFMAWCMEFDNLQAFLTLYFEWAMNDFVRWYSPSIDRINPAKGYTLDNLQWLSFADNCEKNNKDPIDHREIAA